MKKNAISGIMLTLLLIGMLTLASNVQPVEASGTIYIRADGSVDPPTAPIRTVDNITYTFTDNIYDEIVVERSNIIVDGNGYTLQGSGVTYSKGFYLSGISNVTIQDTDIKSFYFGIYVYQSSFNTVSGNTITDNRRGILLVESSNNVLRNNIMAGNRYNFGVTGSTLSDFLQDVDDSNTVDGKPVYYLVNRSDMEAPSDAGLWRL